MWSGLSVLDIALKHDLEVSMVQSLTSAKSKFLSLTAMSESVDAYFDIVGLLEANYI